MVEKISAIIVLVGKMYLEGLKNAEEIFQSFNEKPSQFEADEQPALASDPVQFQDRFSFHHDLKTLVYGRFLVDILQILF